MKTSHKRVVPQRYENFVHSAISICFVKQRLWTEWNFGWINGALCYCNG